MESPPTTKSDFKPNKPDTTNPNRDGDTGISIVIPAYNEEYGVTGVVKNLIEQLDITGYPFEIITVDDGSIDRTSEKATAAGAKVVQHTTNRGYGAAVKTGIRHAQHPLICITDADDTYPAHEILKLVDHFNITNCDMVVGSRTGKDVAIPLIRKPAKWVIGRFANLVSGSRIPDVNSGMRIFRREVGLRFFSLLPNGFSLTTTITLAMLSNGYLVEYIPIDYRPRIGRSKIHPVRDTFNFFRLILGISLHFAPLKIFLSLSVVLLLTALGWALISKLVLGKLADVSTIVIIMTAIQVGVLGLLAEVINRRMPNDYKNRY